MKALIEKKNDLITRAEEVLNLAKAELRELTEDEAAELAEIRDNVRKILETLQLEDDFYVEGIAEANETAEVLQQLISEIPEPDREILIRYYYYRQTAPQIAEKLGIKLPTVKSKLQRTRQKLRLKLTERGYSV